MKKRLFRAILHTFFHFILLSVICMSIANAGDTIIIGSRGTPTIDPHLMNDAVNNAIASHWVGRLTLLDNHDRVIPGLAVKWEATNDTTWQFILRKGVQFHDGSEFSAQDVLASFERIRKLKTFSSCLAGITGIETPDPYTLIIKTGKPIPTLPYQVNLAAIIPEKIAKTATSEDFNKSAAGAGPYRFVEFVPGEKIVFQRNERYWGDLPAYKKAVFRIFSDDATRLSALMGGKVDMIDYVPSSEVARLKENGFTVIRKSSSRVIYMVFDNSRDNSPYVKDRAGNSLPRNPFRDIRVRQAVSKAIYRKFLVNQVMGGFAIPATQLIPEGAFGYNPDLLPEKFDPEGAKQLLADAGYPEGFSLVLHGPNNRYVNDGPVCEAVAKMLTRAGIITNAETMPKKDFFSKMRPPDNQFSFYLIGWAGDTEGLFMEQLHTYDEKRSLGLYNGGHSNPEFDKLVQQAVSVIDPVKREKMLGQAMSMLVRNYEVIPLYSLVSLIATRKEVVYEPRTDNETYAMNARPVTK